jgi:hypothetical protein
MAGTSFASGLGVGPKGTGTILTRVVKGTVSVTVAATAAAGEEDVVLTISGAEAGDSISLTPPVAAMETGLSIAGVWVSDDDEVTVRLSNLSGSSLTGSTTNWTYLLIKS